jgi:hypothetical protein
MFRKSNRRGDGARLGHFASAKKESGLAKKGRAEMVDKPAG